MRSEYSMSCKFCGRRKQFVSTWINVEVLQTFANFWIFFHVLRHHPKELTSKRIIRSMYRMTIGFITMVAYFLLTLLRIITWPLWWILDFIHN